VARGRRQRRAEATARQGVTCRTRGIVCPDDASGARSGLCAGAARARRPRSTVDLTHDHVRRGLCAAGRACPMDAAVRSRARHASAASRLLPRARPHRLAGVSPAASRHGVRRDLRWAAAGDRHRTRRRTPRLGPPHADRRVPDRTMETAALAASARRGFLSTRRARPGAGDRRTARRFPPWAAAPQPSNTQHPSLPQTTPKRDSRLEAQHRLCRIRPCPGSPASGHRPPPHGSSLTRQHARVCHGSVPRQRRSFHSAARPIAESV
jgi:hypothetical protein